MALQIDEDWQLSKKTVLERSCHMFNNPFISDIKFTCGDGSTHKFFFAHKYVLATSSPVFHAMFYGVLAEKKSLIHLPDTDEESMEVFLRFLYTDECISDAGDAVLALKVIYLAKKYMVPSLAEKCWEIIDDNVDEVLDSDLFLTVDVITLEDFLKRETLVILGGGELKLIQAVLKWCDHQCSGKDLDATGENRRAALGSARHHLRFLALTQEEFASNIALSGLLKLSEVVDFYQVFSGMPDSSDGKELTCDLPGRTGNSMSCIRFAQKDLMKPDKSRWTYTRFSYEILKFDVDRPGWFHGVRLFGDANGGFYQVAMEEPIKLSGTYKSTSSNERAGGCLGFDVMFPEPVEVHPWITTSIMVQITGPSSYYGQNGKPCVAVDGLTVTFGDDIECMRFPSNGTTVERGQIYELIISCDDEEEN